jgi:hypothetical protein
MVVADIIGKKPLQVALIDSDDLIQKVLPATPLSFAEMLSGNEAREFEA